VLQLGDVVVVDDRRALLVGRNPLKREMVVCFTDTGEESRVKQKNVIVPVWRFGDEGCRGKDVSVYGKVHQCHCHLQLRHATFGTLQSGDVIAVKLFDGVYLWRILCFYYLYDDSDAAAMQQWTTRKQRNACEPFHAPSATDHPMMEGVLVGGPRVMAKKCRKHFKSEVFGSATSRNMTAVVMTTNNIAGVYLDACRCKVQVTYNAADFETASAKLRQRQQRQQSRIVLSRRAVKVVGRKADIDFRQPQHVVLLNGMYHEQYRTLQKLTCALTPVALLDKCSHRLCGVHDGVEKLQKQLNFVEQAVVDIQRVKVEQQHQSPQHQQQQLVQAATDALTSLATVCQPTGGGGEGLGGEGLGGSGGSGGSGGGGSGGSRALANGLRQMHNILQVSWKPPKDAVMPARAAHEAELYDKLRRFLDLGSPGSVTLTGTPGTGKTTCIQRVIARLEDDTLTHGKQPPITVRVNMMKQRSRQDVALNLLRMIRPHQRHKLTGAVTALSALWSADDPVPRVVLIVDDADGIEYNHSETKQHRFMLWLFQLPIQSKHKVAILAIMNKSVGTDFANVRSRMPLTTMGFAPYTRDELVKIVQQREQLVGHHCLDELAVQIIAGSVASIVGDARTMIHTLSNAIALALAEKATMLTTQHARAALKTLRVPNYFKFVPAMSITEKMMLGGLAIWQLRRDVNWVPFPIVAQEFQKLLRAFGPAMGFMEKLRGDEMLRVCMQLTGTGHMNSSALEGELVDVRTSFSLGFPVFSAATVFEQEKFGSLVTQADREYQRRMRY
jgi:Cdc6-like AAA superfamily ATPase